MHTELPASWFRLYAEFAVDPKVQMLSEVDQRRFIMLLCLRCCNGDVTLQDSHVTFQLRISSDEWATTKATLMHIGLITNDNKPTAWEKRQFHSDSSRERVARFRENKKKACNVTVTPRGRGETETETETEKNKTSSPIASVDVKFSEFWKAYPRKVGKGAAENAWKKAKINGSASDVIAALETQKTSDAWKRDNGQYIPNPATWINQRRWEDELDTAQGKASNVWDGDLSIFKD